MDWTVTARVSKATAEMEIDAMMPPHPLPDAASRQLSCSKSAALAYIEFGDGKDVFLKIYFAFTSHNPGVMFGIQSAIVDGAELLDVVISGCSSDDDSDSESDSVWIQITGISSGQVAAPPLIS